MKITCKACGVPYRVDTACKCWGALRVSAARALSERAAKGGCSACGSLNREKSRRRPALCTQCSFYLNDKAYGIQLIMAGYCPVCCALPHRRDGETCSWCGELYAELPAQDIDTWEGYSTFSPEDVSPSGYSPYTVVVECRGCGKEREVSGTNKKDKYEEARLCRECASKKKRKQWKTM